ncbi:MAG: imidazoleglycerol-phosphate dehydratase, partial [Pirellulaceae bacterium]|jgi:imidazoleglycerol-phosphate dehydratase
MDETLVTAAVDLSGRAAVVYQAPIASPKIGSFDSELVEHFWTSFAHQAACNLHVLLHHGSNSHHIAEAVFKGLARALRMACQVDPRQSGIPSSKGRLVD